MNIETEPEIGNTESKYNEEPVFYCTHCLSLKVRRIPIIEDGYCEDCNSTSIEHTSIFEWEKLYEGKFKHKYLERYKNGRNKRTWFI